MYNVVIPDRASKDLEKIDKNSEDNPFKNKRIFLESFRYSTKLSDTRIGDYRFRIGKYRVILI